MHVIFIPYALMKIDPASWMKMITKFKGITMQASTLKYTVLKLYLLVRVCLASVAVVKSRDMHWGLLAQKEHKDINLSSLRMLLVADGVNPCTSLAYAAVWSIFM